MSQPGDTNNNNNWRIKMKDKFVGIFYPTFDEAMELVDRISVRVSEFDKTMSNEEKEAMAQLLSNIGVTTRDLLDIRFLADNYAINAEIVTPEEVNNYSRSILEDSLFTWEEDGETHYCVQW